MSAEFYNKAQELLGLHQPFVTAFVVRAEKPTSAKPGDKAIITAAGELFGWVGGSCAQPTVVREAIKALAEGEPRLIRLSSNPKNNPAREGLLELPMTCFSGGTLEIYIEPQLPAPRLMIIGNLPIAQTLARLGKVMKYQVVLVDLDPPGTALPEADEFISELDQILPKISPLTYIVVASHGNYDEIALTQALRSKAAYVALVSSKTRAAAVLEYLAAQGLTPEELARLKYPAGLDIQALQSEEIALSIMTEIVQKRRSTRLNLVETTSLNQVRSEPVIQNSHSRPIIQLATASASPGTSQAIDPVCGMTVEIATAKYISEHENRFYYFCAANCKLTFDKAPLNYIQAV